MPKSLTDRLCTHCGLCCDGSLFGDVELASRKEADGLTILGLEIDDDGDGEVLVQPCRALQGTRCGVYAHRPECCRTFACRLLLDAGSGAVSVERARTLIDLTLADIGRVTALLPRPGRGAARLPLRERCAEALATEPGRLPATVRRRARLQDAIERADRRIREHFLPRVDDAP